MRLPFLRSKASMKTSHVLEAADVKVVGLAAEAEAHMNNWPVSIAIVDSGGSLLSLQRLDGAAPATVQMASAKANTAALVQRDSKHFEDMINGGRVAFLSAPQLRGVLEGGVVIVKNGQCIGAVGVSGVKPFEDAQIARAGIAALDL
jgi:glc operon protein GlcG